jgi:hypothetical protein
MTNLKSSLLSMIILLLAMNIISSCSQSRKNELKLISGELYFKLISFDGFYGAPDSLINKFESYVDSIASVKNLNEDDQQFLKAYQILKSNDLLDLPSFSMKIDSVTNIQVYLEENEYESIKNYDRSELIRENSKVEIVLAGEFISDKIVRCSKIITATKVEGKTYWRK